MQLHIPIEARRERFDSYSNPFTVRSNSVSILQTVKPQSKAKIGGARALNDKLIQGQRQGYQANSLFVYLDLNAMLLVIL